MSWTVVPNHHLRAEIVETTFSFPKFRTVWGRFRFFYFCFFIQLWWLSSLMRRVFHSVNSRHSGRTVDRIRHESHLHRVYLNNLCTRKETTFFIEEDILRNGNQNEKSFPLSLIQRPQVLTENFKFEVKSCKILKNLRAFFHSVKFSVDSQHIALTLLN